MLSAGKRIPCMGQLINNFKDALHESIESRWLRLINNYTGRKRILDNDLWAPPTSCSDSASISRLSYSSSRNQIHHHINRFTCSGYQTMIWSFVSPGAWTSSRVMPARFTVKRSENTFWTVYQVIGQREPVLPKQNYWDCCHHHQTVVTLVG